MAPSGGSARGRWRAPFTRTRRRSSRAQQSGERGAEESASAFPAEVVMPLRPEDFGLTKALVQAIEVAERRRREPGLTVFYYGFVASIILGWLIGFAYHGIFGAVTGLFLGPMVLSITFFPLAGLAALLGAVRRKHPRLADYERYKAAIRNSRGT